MCRRRPMPKRVDDETRRVNTVLSVRLLKRIDD
jgi:hypothetical protein